MVKTNLGVPIPGLDFSIESKGAKDMDAKLVWKGTSNLTLADLQGAEKSVRTGAVRAREYVLGQLRSSDKTKEE